MPRKGKKSGKKKSPNTIGDVTLYDYADARVCGRPKKSMTSVETVIKQIAIDDRTWDQKIEDFSDEFNFVKEENPDGTTSFVIKKVECLRRKTESDQSHYKGADYPLDIWFLISDYIRPEDVGRFAGICKTTYDIINSAKFWFALYRRYYKAVPTLPERLQPECMVRLYGLRACVIRALFFMYAPFVTREKSILWQWIYEPRELVKMHCVSMWNNKVRNKWVYYFKLKENSIPFQYRTKKPSRKIDLLQMLEDTSANSEENCKIIRVNLFKSFKQIPLVIGLTLTYVNIDRGSSRVVMRFGSAINCKYRDIDGGGGTVIDFHPIDNVTVLDWWDPLYPHSQTTPIISNEE